MHANDAITTAVLKYGGFEFELAKYNEEALLDASQDGIFVVVITMNLRTGKLRKSPDIISRGFIYLRESQELLGETRLIIKKTVEDTFKKSSKPEIDDVKNELIDVIAHFLLQKTHKNPIVIPVIVGV